MCYRALRQDVRSLAPPLSYLKMKMKSMSSMQKVATLSIVFISTTSCLCRAGMKRTSFSTRISRNVLSTDRPPPCWPTISHTLRRHTHTNTSIYKNKGKCENWLLRLTLYWIEGGSGVVWPSVYTVYATISDEAYMRQSASLYLANNTELYPFIPFETHETDNWASVSGFTDNDSHFFELRKPLFQWCVIPVFTTASHHHTANCSITLRDCLWLLTTLFTTHIRMVISYCFYGLFG